MTKGMMELDHQHLATIIIQNISTKQYQWMLKLMGPSWMRNGTLYSTLQSTSHQKTLITGFPGGAVVENLPANAGNTGSSPGLGRSHMLRSNWAREPQLLSLRIWSLCSATGEATTVRGPRTAMKSGPHSPQLEKAHAQKRRPNTAKNK